MKQHGHPNKISGLSAILLGFVVACGGKSAVDQMGGSGATVGSNAGSDATGGSNAGGGGSAGTAAGGASSGGAAAGGASSGGPCPASPPLDGASCTVPYKSSGIAKCSYGDDPRPQCRTLAVCDTGKWRVSSATCTTPPRPAACPTPRPSDNSACPDSSLSCWYGDGARCDCNACEPRGGSAQCRRLVPPQWSCVGPGTGCPTAIPQAGTLCGTPNAECGADCTLSITCTDGVWQYAGNQCGL